MPTATILQQINNRLDAHRALHGQQAKYRQLSEAVLQLAEDNILKPGDRLPTESELARSLPFSLGTIQKALRNLAELGVVDRRAGRGTVIAAKSTEIFDLWQFRFVDPMTDRVFPAFSRVTDLSRVAPGDPWSRFLPDDPCYVRIEREIDVDGRFRVLSSFYVPDSLCTGMGDRAPADLEGVHLHAVLRRDFGLSTGYLTNRITCTTVPDAVCLRLGLPSAARGLLCHIRGYSARDKPLWFHEIHVPADADPMEFREVRPAR
ncbi:GntR family transcriptional regulator [uncultured Roseobacter sp.]|uniref:GntR family transcriptional regulator n=1 Tax=uncultured Roseobacter sp. TaxID=114847 RepID=UPI002602F631|nr:GntR family transcriptional regulator [uncultured Roseobacter sp.]